MDRHRAKQVVGLAVTVSAYQRLDQVVPSSLGRLLDVTSRPGAHLGDRFGEQFRPRPIRFVGPDKGDLTGFLLTRFLQRRLRVRGAGSVDKLVQVVNTSTAVIAFAGLRFEPAAGIKWSDGTSSNVTIKVGTAKDAFGSNCRG